MNNMTERFSTLMPGLRSVLTDRRVNAELHANGKVLGLVPLWETLLGIGLVLGAAALFPAAGWGFLDWQLHPLWVVVLAISVRYGGRNGYMAGGLAALTYTLLIWTRPEAHHQLPTPHELIQPFAMLAVGAMLGELTAARERRLHELEHVFKRTLNENRLIRERYTSLEKAKTYFEKEFVFGRNPVETFSVLCNRLHSLDLTELYPAILELISQALPAQACCLYRCNENGLGLLARWPAERPQAGLPSQIDALLLRAIQDGRVVTASDQLRDARAASRQVLMASPLMLGNGRTYAVIGIEAAPLVAISPAGAQRLAALSVWAGKALDNALLYEQVLAGSLNPDPLVPELDWLLTPQIEQR